MDLSKRATPLPREVRQWAVQNFELRAGDNDGTLRFVGDAAIADHTYTLRDAFGEFSETVVAGAWDKTLASNPDVILNVNHEGLPLARTTSGTLRLSATPDLHVEADLDASDPDVQRIEPKMRRGDLNEMSWAFRVVRQEWNEDYTDRKILEASIQRGDVSIVNYGANPVTHGALRSLGFELDEFEAAVDALRSGDADDGQIAYMERAIGSLNDLLPKAPEVPAEIWDDLARLGDKFHPFAA